MSFSRARVAGTVADRAMRPCLFYGWWIVAACLVSGTVANGFGLYGAGVYLHTVTAVMGWSVGLVSGGITVFYVVSALLLTSVGVGVSRFGPRPVVGLGALALAAGVAGIGQASQPWQVYTAFVVMGVGWSCLSMTAITATLAPWFDRHYGRAVSIASLGASIGGMIGPPVLVLGIARISFLATTMAASVLTVVALLPLAWFVLRRRPQDMGLLPDGAPSHATASAAGTHHCWKRLKALRTAALGSVVASFGIGMMVQIGFLTQQVALITSSLSAPGAAAVVSTTAAAALVGRLGLARFADRINARNATAAVLLLAAAALGALALFPVPAVLVGASMAYGLTVGNVTILSPIIVRREFGAASFGAVYGVASTGIQLVAAMGPGFYGLLHDASGGYGLPLLSAAVLDVLAAGLVVLGGRKPLTSPKSPGTTP